MDEFDKYDNLPTVENIGRIKCGYMYRDYRDIASKHWRHLKNIIKKNVGKSWNQTYSYIKNNQELNRVLTVNPWIIDNLIERNVIMKRDVAYYSDGKYPIYSSSNPCYYINYDTGLITLAPKLKRGKFKSEPVNWYFNGNRYQYINNQWYQIIMENVPDSLIRRYNDVLFTANKIWEFKWDCIREQYDKPLLWKLNTSKIFKNAVNSKTKKQLEKLRTTS